MKVDPVATRQKLDHLRLNTPFERAKLARSTGDLIGEESRQRRRLVSDGEAGLERLRTLELIARHGVRIVLQEAQYRQQLCASEQAARSSCLCAADQHIVALALQSSEAAARKATVAREREQFASLLWRCAHATQVVQLRQREATTREALRYNESSLWHRLQAAEVDSRSHIADNVMTRLRFFNVFSESREGVCREWYAGLESLVAAAAAHRELISQHVQQRWSFLRAAEQGKRDLAAEETATRLRVREEMAEEADYLAECTRIFARQRATFFKSEVSQRQGICAEAESGYHAIFLDMKADEDNIREVAVQQAERRQSALFFALDTLCSIQYEEHAAFEELLLKARRDVAGRLAWMEEKAGARAALLQQCVEEKETVVAAAEAAARGDLARALAEGEVGVAQWVASKHHAQEELSRVAHAALNAVAAAEHEARFRLLSHMATQEERVLQWCEEKRVVRACLMEEELSQRTFVVQQEDVCWQAVCSNFVHTGRALEDRLLLQRQERARALSVALDDLACIAHEEERERARLRECAAEDAHRAVAVYDFRCQLDVLHAETQQRAVLAQDELATRMQLRTKMTLSARYVAEAALAALRLQLCGVAAAEDSARRCFYEEVGDWYERVAAGQRAEELRLIRDLELRIDEELRARHTYMTEDARLYTEEEALALPACSGSAENADGGHLMSSSGGMHELRKALVMQMLGNPVCTANLSSTAVDFVMAVVDRAGRRRDYAQEAVATATRLARDASKKLVQCERLLAAEKEKREMYDVSSHREAEERQRRLHGESLDKARSQQSIAAEKRRLAEVQVELQELKTLLDTLKSSINKQFSR